jgi:hypothetical protein
MQAQPYSLLGVQESIAQNTPTSAFIINRQSNKETKSVSIKQEMNEEVFSFNHHFWNNWPILLLQFKSIIFSLVYIKDRPIVLSSRIVPLQLQTCKERETLPNTILTNLNVETYNKLTSRS